MVLVGAWTTTCNLKAFRWLEINPVTELQLQGANSKNRTIRIITIKIAFYHSELVNISQSKVTEGSGECITLIILIMYMVMLITLGLISGIYVQYCL